MKRRKFIALSIALLTTSLFAKKNSFNITMIGDLDDDLFIIKSCNSYTEMLECHQMHNCFTNKFLYENKLIDSVHVPGYIEFNKSFSIKDNEVLFLFNANEREALHGGPTLFKRTHYKSTNLDIDGLEFFPEIMPENNSIPNYATWYNQDESKEMGNYNYYHMWENSVVNSGLIFKNSGNYRIICLNEEEEIVLNTEQYISKNVEKINFNVINEISNNQHPLLETDGLVYSNDFKSIKKNAIHKIVITGDKIGLITVNLPYPSPYVNRIFARSMS